MSRYLISTYFKTYSNASTIPALFPLASFFLASFFLMFSSLSYSATAYISDELTVPLRSGPSGAHRILHRGLPSGTNLEVIGANEEAGFTQIRTSRGTEGWLRTQYLVSQPIAKVQLVQAQRRIATLEKSVTTTRAEIRQLKSTASDQQNANAAGSAKIGTLQKDLERIQKLSASAVETHEKNLQLTETNTRLRDELDDVAEARDILADNEANQGIMLGAGLILLGLIAGVLIKARPQRSAWS